MKRILKSIVSAALCMVMGITAVTASAATTGYFNSYDQVSIVPNKGGCTIMQGMAVASNCMYTVKVNSDDTKARIFKTTKSTGKTTVLKNATEGTAYFTYLGHANDLCVKNYNNGTNLFVATTRSDDYGLVRLIVKGKKVTKNGNYKLTLDGKDMYIGGVSILEKTTKKTTFLFKKGKNFYTGTLNNSSTSGTIELTKAFKINTSSVTIKNKTVDISGYTSQAFDLKDNKIFVVWWNKQKPQQSVIVVYDITDASGTIKAEENLSFRITSSAYPLFEIESCGIASDGKLYFNANRRVSSTDINHDAVMCFQNYTFS